LLVDLYELTMGESYLAEGLEDKLATFSLSCRHLPEGWGYLLAAGLERAPTTGFGVGSKLGLSADAPFLDMA